MNNVRKLKKSRKSKPKGPSTPTRDQYEVPSTTPPPSSVKRKLGDGHDKADKKGKKKHRASNQELNTDENHENDVTASRRDKSQDVDAQLSSLTSQSQRHSSLNKPTTPAGEEDSFVKTSGVRGPRLKSDGRPLKIGFFTKEEVQKIEKFKVDFCNQHSLESHKEFDHLVQHSERTSAEPWPLDADVCSKQQFWEQIYELAPDRDRRSLYRFMRRHFQESFQKAHEWTPAQDEELIQLMREHSGKWTAVAKMLGRSDDDVTQRWKNKLQHRDKMNRGSWSEKELRDLLDGVERFFALYKKEHEDASCIDIYEMPDGHITWSHISDSMDNMRTRQQCADKWRKIRNKVLNARAAGETNAVFDVVAEAKKPPPGICGAAKSKERLLC
ncbi:hypothetical protein N7468_004232 [Penicillium chermesinum]|uniref:Uncharacterized protein n=1 Tax=Penicillium chermesinum TaxID=63820 RepID=A0A9W9P823_9EURO|nr:uncharacterized protein N7468_004232 [Penicillium chermesinum]KAJ5239613.1 hypothetical protein N7468_004232 [Penicillium chermesinum]